MASDHHQTPEEKAAIKARQTTSIVAGILFIIWSLPITYTTVGGLLRNIGISPVDTATGFPSIQAVLAHAAVFGVVLFYVLGNKKIMKDARKL